MLIGAIPTHKAAQWLLSHVRHILEKLGLENDPDTEEIIYIGLVVVIALAAGWLVRRGILYVAQKFVKLRNTEIGAELLQQHTLTRCSHIISPLVILALIPFAFTSDSPSLGVVQKCLYIYTVIAVAVAVNAVLTFVWMRYDIKRNTRNLPLKGILNIGMGIVWAIVVIVSVSILINRSPAVLLGGLGAFAAALMLIFKDTILGFVAGIQLSQNDMLHVGDWIVVPSTPANGIVTDVSLTAVKVQNFDNTIVTLPPYTLVSTSFQNWRGMSQSGCRRIMRSVTFESESVVEIDDAAVDALTAKFPVMKPWVDDMKATGKAVYAPGVATVNGTVATNLGLFRAYLCSYILSNDAFNHDSQVLVRIMDPTPNGFPLQVWCFTSTTVWTAYEAIQSALFEHIAVVAPQFNLKIYNNASVLDTTAVQMMPGPAH
ncbi:MAG: mechanosensitive ion channel family protein [Duncaniella sp.]|nr:mechanosensitive ion channel family protein [Duncaniella sp.]